MTLNLSTTSSTAGRCGPSPSSWAAPVVRPPSAQGTTAERDAGEILAPGLERTLCLLLDLQPQRTPHPESTFDRRQRHRRVTWKPPHGGGRTRRGIPEAVEVDVLTFERMVAAGSAPALADALAIYQGDFDGFSVDDPQFEEWRRSQRDR